MLPKVLYRFYSFPMKIPMTYVTEIEQAIMKFIWKSKKPRIAKAIRSRKSETGYHKTRSSTVLQSNSNKNGMVLVPK